MTDGNSESRMKLKITLRVVAGTVELWLSRTELGAEHAREFVTMTPCRVLSARRGCSS